MLTICCEEEVAVAGSVQPLDLVDFLFNFKTFEVIKLGLMALKLHKKFVLWGLWFLLLGLCGIFVLMCISVSRMPFMQIQRSEEKEKENQAFTWQRSKITTLPPRSPVAIYSPVSLNSTALTISTEK